MRIRYLPFFDFLLVVWSLKRPGIRTRLPETLSIVIGERSEANPSRRAEKEWIASSLRSSQERFSPISRRNKRLLQFGGAGMVPASHFAD